MLPWKTLSGWHEFGLEPGVLGTDVVTWSATWSEALPALGYLLGWTIIAALLARRAITWEPRG